MVEGRCAIVSKWLLVIFNIVFCFIGGGLIITGTYAYIQLKDYTNFFGDVNINAPAMVMITFGVITFGIAAIGCVGAMKESPCFLYTFSVTIGILLVSEMAAGAVAFAFQSDLKEFVLENAVTLMHNYNESRDDYVKEAWDLMHAKLECCGVAGPSDWRNTSIAHKQEGVVPASCNNSTSGCVDSFIDFAYDNILLIGAAGIAFASCQITGIVFGCVVACAAKKNSVV